VTREAALQILHEFTKSDSLRRHALAVEACVAAYARKFGADEQEWSVTALLHDRGGASLQALLIRAGFPESTFAAFRVALEVSLETGYVDTASGAARLRRRMVERVLTHCETDPLAAEPLLILLRRFATESAREEARMFCDELIAEEATSPEHDLIAA